MHVYKLHKLQYRYQLDDLYSFVCSLIRRWCSRFRTVVKKCGGGKVKAQEDTRAPFKSIAVLGVQGMRCNLTRQGAMSGSRETLMGNSTHSRDGCRGFRFARSGYLRVSPREGISDGLTTRILCKLGSSRLLLLSCDFD